MSAAGEITLLLQRVGNPHDHAARQELFLLVEQELRTIAATRLRRLSPGDTLQTTALIDDAFMRLLDYRRIEWEGRDQFFRVAGGVIRRILCNQVRQRLRHPPGTPLASAEHAQLRDARCAAPDERLHWYEMLHRLLETLDKLEQENAVAVAVFEWRAFGGRCLVLDATPGGFTIPDPVTDLLPFTKVAAILKIPRSTAFAQWSWVVERLQSELHAFAPPDFLDADHDH